MATKKRSIAETMKDLYSSDETSTGGAIATLNKKFAEMNRRLLDAAKQVTADVQAKIRDACAIRLVRPGSPGMLYRRRPTSNGASTTPDTRAMLEDINRNLDEIARIRREFDNFRPEPLGPEQSEDKKT